MYGAFQKDEIGWDEAWESEGDKRMGLIYLYMYVCMYVCMHGRFVWMDGFGK